MNKKFILALVVIGIIAILGLFLPTVRGTFGSAITATDITATRFTQLLVDNGIFVSAGGMNNDGIATLFTRNASLNQASTTVCAIQNGTATTTIQRATLQETVSSTTASFIDIGISSNPTATTTIIGSASVAANAAVTISIASSTIFAPNLYMVVNQKAGAGLIANPTGVCTLITQSVN